MNFEQNNMLKNEPSEPNETKSPSSSKEAANNDSIISAQELIDLQNKDEERVSFELAKIRESIGDNLDNDKKSEGGFDLTIKEGETDFDFLGRLSKFLVDKQERQNIQNNPDENHKIIKLLKKKSYQIAEVYQDKDNEKLIRLSLIKAMESSAREELLNNEKNEKCLNDIDISTSSRNMSLDLNEKSEYKDRVGFFSETNQERSFFPSRYENDGIYYSGSLFNVHSKSPEAIEYLKNKLDGKVIYLLGGGKSANDLLQDTQINPKQVINIDPFISEEDIERNKKGFYISISERADSKNLMQEVKNSNIELADEIWASYSVPFYNESQEEIDNLITNIKGLLKEGGNCRITPISAQNEQAKQAIMNNLKQIVDSKEYNIHTDQDTLIIHKLQKKD